jgi:hypothetical protein
MYRASTVIAMTSMLFVGAQAFSDHPPSHAAMNRRQIINCMSKQMAANKSISYNDAAKTCKDQLKVQHRELGLSVPPPSVP